MTTTKKLNWHDEESRKIVARMRDEAAAAGRMTLAMTCTVALQTGERAAWAACQKELDGR